MWLGHRNIPSRGWCEDSEHSGRPRRMRRAANDKRPSHRALSHGSDDVAGRALKWGGRERGIATS